MNNMDNFLSENGMEALSSLTAMIVAQQNIALGLTKLILENCVEEIVSKEEVFEIYGEACDIVRSESNCS